jgi:hypothetical protein
MPNSLVTINTQSPILATPIAKAVTDMTNLVLDPFLTLAYFWGLIPTSYIVSSGGGLVTTTLALAMVPLSTATATAALIGGSAAAPVKAITVTGAGGQYARPPVVTLTSTLPPLQPALAHAKMQVSGVYVAAGGSAYTGATIATFSGGSLAPGGTPAVAGAVTVMAGAVTAVAVATPGGPYDIPPVCVISDTGGGTGAMGFAGLSVASIVLDFAGVGYSAAPTVVIAPLFKQMCPDSAGNANQAATMKGLLVQAQQMTLKSPTMDTIVIS